MKGSLAVLLLSSAAVAGCLSADAPDDGPGPRHSVPAPAFSTPVLIDEVRAGGEPVIAIAQDGTILVSSHPGPTHYHPSDPTQPGDELLLPYRGQSYLWRSTDTGSSWTHVGFQTIGEGPRSTGFGVSDPEFTVMEDGTVCYTDLMALAESSVSCSEDAGATWSTGNPAAAGGPNDRQWLASVGKELYFTANYFRDHHIRASTDHGLTWEDRGDVPCAQDLVGNPHNGHLVVACPDGIAISEDGGRTWSEVRTAPEGTGGQRLMSEPAIDAAGNVWIVMTDGEETVWAAGTPDEGLTWPWVLDLGSAWRDAFDGDGTFVWPWISAGSDGRFAVSWFGTAQHEDSTQNHGPWFVYAAFVYDATTEPTVHIVQVTPEPIHERPICQSGTTCQAASIQGDPSGDRRLGDFFETTIDAEGHWHGVWSNTAKQPSDVVSHVEYARQVGGEPLLLAQDVGVFHPTQG